VERGLTIAETLSFLSPMDIPGKICPEKLKIKVGFERLKMLVSFITIRKSQIILLQLMETFSE